jgi:hypothetical protein
MRKSRAILLAVALIAVSVCGNLFWIDHIWRNYDTKAQWPTTQGVVNSFSEYLDFEYDEIRFSSEFAYEIGGLRYTADQFWIVGRFSAANTPRYNTGEIVTVYYNPEKPDTSVINPWGQSWTFNVVGFGLKLGGLVAVIYAIIIVWSNRHNPWL